MQISYEKIEKNIKRLLLVELEMYLRLSICALSPESNIVRGIRLNFAKSLYML